jgi:hypothetical protein
MAKWILDSKDTTQGKRTKGLKRFRKNFFEKRQEPSGGGKLSENDPRNNFAPPLLGFYFIVSSHPKTYRYWQF